MSVGLPFVDSLDRAGLSLLEAAKSFLGSSPVAWGRYFHSPAKSDYNSAAESPFLAANQIRVLPIARQTTHVNGSSALGDEDGRLNAQAILSAFAAPHLASQGAGKFFVFLDVEGDRPANPSLSIDYFTGWAGALRQEGLSISGGSVELLPCVYARSLDDATWNVLAQASAGGTECFGGWVARMLSGSACNDGPIGFDGGKAEPQMFLPFEIFAWQYALGCGNLDFSQTNPAVDAVATFLPFLISP